MRFERISFLFSVIRKTEAQTFSSAQKGFKQELTTVISDVAGRRRAVTISSVMHNGCVSIRTTNQSISVSYSYFNLLKMHGRGSASFWGAAALSAQGARLSFCFFSLGKELWGGERPRIATWLILPVVIRLSQRLSHACLSINLYTVKLRMAHYISYSLFDSPLLLG